MKKIISLLLAALLLLSLTACGGNNGAPAETGSQAQTQGQQEPAPTQGQTQDTTPEDWGVDGKISLFTDVDSCKLKFKWPHYYGNSANTGEAAPQQDGTLVLVDRYMMGSSPEKVELKDFYPAYLEQTVAAYAGFYGHQYKDGKITVGEGQMETIGEYEVCKYTGKHTYTYKDNTNEHQIVVYATVAKKNQSLVYWVVEDITEDQSAGQLIQDHAKKIIQSIKEN